MCSFGDGSDVWLQRLVRARKTTLVCEECNLPIPKRGLFWSITWAEEGRGGNFSLHPECYTLAQRAAEVVCGSPDYQAGELEHHLDEASASLEDPTYREYAEYDPDPDDARELLLQYVAIDHKYGRTTFDSSGWQDLGGEG